MKNNFTLLLVLLIVIFSSCNSDKKGSSKETNVTSTNSTKLDITEEDGYKSVPLLYGTNRVKGYTDQKHVMFNPQSADEISYGIVRVSIPDEHRKGQLEQANTLNKMLGNDYNPKKYVNVLENKTLSNTEFHAILKTGLSLSEDKEMFVFIHGYNTSFTDAAKRTAQLFYDIEYTGIPMFYSWPSNGKLARYLDDGKQIDYSFKLFGHFINDIVSKNPEKKINIIAHSMGNRLMVKALSMLPKENPSIKFGKIIMAAPDVDAKDFKINYLETLAGMSEKVTLYSSSKDIALLASSKVNSTQRLGMAGKSLFVSNPKIQTIDLSGVDCEDFLKHACFANSMVILKDIRNVLSNEPVDRVAKKNKDGEYYILTK